MQQYQQSYNPGAPDYQPYSLQQQQQQQPEYLAPYLPQQPGNYGFQPTQQPFTQHAPAAAALPSQHVLLTAHPAAAPVAVVHPVHHHPGPHGLQQHYAPGQYQPQQQQHLGPQITQQFGPWSSQPRPMYRAHPHPGQYPGQQQQQQQQSMAYPGHQLWHQQPAPSQYQQQVRQGYLQPPAGQLRASLTTHGQYPAPQQQQLQAVPQPYGQGQQQPVALQYQQLPHGDRKASTQPQKRTSQPGQQPSQQQKQQQKQQQIQLTLREQRQREREKREQEREMQEAERQKAEQEQRAATAAAAKRRQEERQRCMEQNMQCSKLLQLPEGSVARIAAWLTMQERVMFAELVLPQNSAVAAEVLGSIHSLRFCREDLRTSEEMRDKKRRMNQQPPFHCTSGSAHVHYSKCPQPMRDTPSFVAALQNLRSLSLELDPSGRKKPGNPEFDPRLSGFARLTDLSGLTSLQLTVLATNKRELEVQEAALKIVAQLSSLRGLAVVVHGVRYDRKTTIDSPSANVFAPLSVLTGLQSLNLQYGRASHDLGLSTLSGLTKLTELQLHEHRSMAFNISQEFADNISHLAPLLAAAKLQKITLRGVSCYHGHYPLAVQPNELRVLDITGCVGLELFPAMTPPTPHCTTLQELRVGSCKELWLAGLGGGRTAVEGDATPAVAALASSLTLLDISDVGLISWGLDFVSRLTSLRSLNTAGTWLGKRAGVIAGAAAGAVVEENNSTLDSSGTLEVLAKQLTGLTSLTMGCPASVYVEQYVIPAGELLWLSRLVHLHTLTVHGSVFEGSGWQAKASKLATCLTECTALKQLTLRGCGFVTGDSQDVSQVLQKAGVGANDLSVVLHCQPDKVTSMQAMFDDGDSDGDTDFDDDDYGGSDGGYGFDMDDEFGEAFDPDTYQDDLGGFYLDGPFGEVYYAADR